MALPKKTRKKTVRARARSGIGAIAMVAEKGWEPFKYYFHYEVDKKDCATKMKAYIKKTFSKADQKSILACPEYKFTMFSHYAATIQWLELGYELPEGKEGYKTSLDKYLNELIEIGKPLLEEKAQEAKAKANVVVLTPQQRLQRKIGETIIEDLLVLEDEWIEGNKPDFDMYRQFQKHGLSTQAIAPVEKILDGWLLDYEDAYHKRCEQAVEGYSHIKRTELNRRIKQIKEMKADLERVRSSVKNTRKPRVKKPQAAEKQVAKMQYLKEDNTFKIKSINPLMIVGAMRMYVFNVKSREITEYVSGTHSGFSVKGTTLQGVDMDASRKIKLRKPEDMLPIFQSKTPKQIDNEWKKLTTKEGQPNGRINKDCVMIRVMDK